MRSPYQNCTFSYGEHEYAKNTVPRSLLYVHLRKQVLSTKHSADIRTETSPEFVALCHKLDKVHEMMLEIHEQRLTNMVLLQNQLQVFAEGEMKKVWENVETKFKTIEIALKDIKDYQVRNISAIRTNTQRVTNELTREAKLDMFQDIPKLFRPVWSNLDFRRKRLFQSKAAAAIGTSQPVCANSNCQNLLASSANPIDRFFCQNCGRYEYCGEVCYKQAHGRDHKNCCYQDPIWLQWLLQEARRRANARN